MQVFKPFSLLFDIGFPKNKTIPRSAIMLINKTGKPISFINLIDPLIDDNNLCFFLLKVKQATVILVLFRKWIMLFSWKNGFQWNSLKYFCIKTWLKRHLTFPKRLQSLPSVGHFPAFPYMQRQRFRVWLSTVIRRPLKKLGKNV